MRIRYLALIFTCLVAQTHLPLQAQGSRGVTQAADFIVAVVNSEPITNHEVMVETRRFVEQLDQQRQPRPADMRALSRQVLERMINERAQLQLARENGIRVEDVSVDQAVRTVANQNQIEVPELLRRLAADGIDVKKFREQLREQITLTRLREREVESRVRVNDQEVEQFLREQQDEGQDPSRQQINLAQILIAVPEGASPEQVSALQSKAQDVLQRARAGGDFAALAREYSQAPDRISGGQLGLRTMDRYPQLFLDAVRLLGPGGISALVRSGAGFHVLKVIEKPSTGLVPAVVTQSRSRHILLRPSAQMSEAQAHERLMDFKKRIASGRSDFAELAKEYSQDGSAAQGGDLGWASPGQFVPEFEAVMNRLTPGQISDPLISRFGVHLIQLMERRESRLSPLEQRELVRGLLRDKKLEEAYVNWVRDVRARAYVELRDPPQ